MDDGLPRVSSPFPRRPKYGDAEIAAVTALLTTGSLSEIGRGPASASLEDAFCELTGTTHALSFNSGTAALHAALHAVGASPDQGVVMSPMTWISAITAAFHAGSFPAFSDLAKGSPNLDPAQIDTENCSAALVTHAWGVPADMQGFADLAVSVVEDCSHAHGALYQRRPVGSWGAAGCFSLQESKAVSGGEGGVLTTSDQAVYQRALTVGHHPFRLAAELTSPDLTPFTHAGASYKYRIPALAAVIACEQLKTLAERMKAAEDNLAHLIDAIEENGLPLRPVALPEGSLRGWYGAAFTVAAPVTDPAALFIACKQRGIPLRALYPDWLSVPLLQRSDLIERYWPHMRGRWKAPNPGDFPVYQQFRRQTVVLKIPDIPAADYIDQVAEALVITRQPF